MISNTIKAFLLFVVSSILLLRISSATKFFYFILFFFSYTFSDYSTILLLAVSSVILTPIAPRSVVGVAAATDTGHAAADAATVAVVGAAVGI
jgi:hypothetical protein